MIHDKRDFFFLSKTENLGTLFLIINQWIKRVNKISSTSPTKYENLGKSEYGYTDIHHVEVSRFETSYTLFILIDWSREKN